MRIGSGGTRVAAASLVVGLVLAGCGSGTAAPTAQVAALPADVSLTGTPQPTSYPLAVDNCGVPVTFTAPPERVLILNGTSVAEVGSLLALDLGDRVLANAQSYGVSDQPGMTERIAALPTGGLTQDDQFDVPAEQVLASGADLVISTWAGGFDGAVGRATREQLAAVGVNSLVNPVNCAVGNPGATDAEQEALAQASPRSSLEFLELLGQIFDVQDRAYTVAEELATRIEAVGAAVAGASAPSVLLVFPGMAMMNENGLPAVFAGGFYDQVAAAAGTVNAFAGAGPDITRTINAEQLAATDVDLLVVASFTPDEVAEQDAQRLFDAFPQWDASRNGAFVAVSDGVYLGTTNAWAIEKIAKAAHPDRL